MSFDPDCLNTARRMKEEENYESYKETKVREVYDDAISKFYEITNGSYKTAEYIARIWAANVVETEWENEDVEKLAIRLELDVVDAYAIMGLSKKVWEIIQDNCDDYRTITDHDIDYNEDKYYGNDLFG